jgi:hypothetical protein
LGRKTRKATATIATPDTLIRWYKQWIADTFDGSSKRKTPGRPRVDEEIERFDEFVRVLLTFHIRPSSMAHNGNVIREPE